MDNGGCDQKCVNKIGTFECSCDDGFVFADDKGKCIGNITNHLCLVLCKSFHLFSILYQRIN